ncbi:MAG: acetyl-CoA carboxylase, carboxyltransferase subunit beta [Chloroflexi bacterium]|nr:acetyl-CoA carboxylase, carboxyltransferase subunit beta [Chloroflexota bacterium]
MKEIFKRHPRYGVAPGDFASSKDTLWVRCPRCRELLYTREQEQSCRVCSKCKYHFQIGARERIDITVDSGSFRECDANLRSVDPLSFESLGESYGAKLRQYAEQSGEGEAFLYGTATIEGLRLVVGATDFRFCGGTMGAAPGEKVTRAIELAEAEALPLVLFSTGGGARMQEGAISLLQMAKTVAALERFKAAGLPYLSVMVDPCLGGTTASYAMLGDVNIAEPGAYIGFAGRRVIEQTMRQKLPPDAATAEFLQQHGMVDLVLSRPEIAGTLARLIRMYVTCNSRAKERRLVEQHA